MQYNCVTFVKIFAKAFLNSLFIKMQIQYVTQ